MAGGLVRLMAKALGRRGKVPPMAKKGKTAKQKAKRKETKHKARVGLVEESAPYIAAGGAMAAASKRKGDKMAKAKAKKKSKGKALKELF